MNGKMKILIVADEVWNDKIHGNNVLSNWFEGFNAEFAEIYCSPGVPLNNCCEQYFQVTDMMMAKTLFRNKKAGRVFRITPKEMSQQKMISQYEHKRLYDFMKSISTESVRVIRDLIWLYGKYDIDLLKKFIMDFNPDIVFCPRLLTHKLLRLEKLVTSMVEVPIVAFTGDDEFSFRQIRFSPVFWVRRYLFNRSFKKSAKIYDYYWMHSEEQAAEYQNKYNLKTGLLFKSGNFSSDYIVKNINVPIRMIYAGRLYCNRWQTLIAISQALKIVNNNELKIILEIYTKDKLNSRQKKVLDDKYSTFYRGSVSASKLSDIYKNADIVLHVESFDLKYKLVTKVSFSTKIIDCLSYSCAVMAIAWEKQTGFKYLKENNAAFCISNKEDILPTLQKIVTNPDLISEYRYKAWEFGKKYHNRFLIQNYIHSIFENLIRLKKDENITSECCIS
jgi:hypothetical protein